MREFTCVHCNIDSKYLSRNVAYDVILPPDFQIISKYSALFLNDGQEIEALNLMASLSDFYLKTQKPFVTVAIYANENRLSEYGVSGHPDYKNRGNKATEYSNFVILELMPEIIKTYGVSSSMNTFCGFSLGGLMAFDIVWEHSDIFNKVGVFSGSFWWRDKSYDDNYDENVNRIMQKKILDTPKKEGLQFWLECGTHDELEDRNNNGVIDAIDDTLAILTNLKKKGYGNETIKYVEIPNGEHSYKTWSLAFPDFLAWAFEQN